MIPGEPEQFTLMPTTSSGEKKEAQASLGSLAPVSVHMPLESICPATARSTFSLSVSMTESALTRTTVAGYLPGMPAPRPSGKGVLILYWGSLLTAARERAGSAGNAAVCRKVRRRIGEFVLF